MTREMCSLSLLLILLSLASSVRSDVKTPQDFVQEAKALVQAVSVHDLKAMIVAKEKIIILDVRDKEEFEKGHIP